MSAFLVSAGTVDVVLSQLQLRDGEELAHLFQPFTAPEDPRDALDELGRQILAANVDALEALYPAHRHDEERAEAAAYVFTSRPEPIGYTLKQIDCLLYQCAEGDVPERPLFEALARMRRTLVDRILEDLPSYSRAPWGVPIV